MLFKRVLQVVITLVSASFHKGIIIQPWANSHLTILGEMVSFQKVISPKTSIKAFWSFYVWVKFLQVNFLEVWSFLVVIGLNNFYYSKNRAGKVTFFNFFFQEFHFLSQKNFQHWKPVCLTFERSTSPTTRLFFFLTNAWKISLIQHWGKSQSAKWPSDNM